MKAELLLGDCLELLPNLTSGSVDMILSDLPYGMTNNKWDSVISLDLLWKEFLRVCKANAVIALTASQPFTSQLVMSAPELFRHEWIWIKNRGSNFVNTIREPMKEHESVLIFSRGKWTFNKQLQLRSEGSKNLVGKMVNFGGEVVSANYQKGLKKESRILSEWRVPASWQKFNTEVGLHPTQKPVDLMRYLIRTYTNENENVLDVTMGSGTTGVAALREGRKFIGIEMNIHFNKAKERIENEPSSLLELLTKD